MRTHSDRNGSDSSSDLASASRAAPGKQTRSEQAVQARGDLTGPDVMATADRGVSGASSQLPHFDAIQQSFGSHDVSGVRAQVGGEAATASREIGAQAYATGDRVGFAQSPDLHTAAHEAAHVVQQQAGVHLKDGVGQSGDAYEQHADAVADAVVRGESAEGLLSSGIAGASGGGSHSGVQRVHDADLTDNSFQGMRTSLVDDADGDVNKAFVRDAADDRLAASDAGKFLTPVHDGTGWGFMVAKAQAEAMRATLQGLNYAGIRWELRDMDMRVQGGGQARYRLLRPVADAALAEGAKAQPAMTPNDCFQKCLHTMQTQHPEVAYTNSAGVDVTFNANDPTLAKAAMFEDAFHGQYQQDYFDKKQEYLAADQGARWQLAKDLNALMLAPYAALSAQERDDFDRDHKINRYAQSGAQEGFITISDTSTSTKNFAFHAGGVLTSDGTDIVTWENFANWAEQYGGGHAQDTIFAVFKMYSNDPASGKTFHDQIAKGVVARADATAGERQAAAQDSLDEYGNWPITMALRAGQPPPPQPVLHPVAPMPLLPGGNAPFDPNAPMPGGMLFDPNLGGGGLGGGGLDPLGGGGFDLDGGGGLNLDNFDPNDFDLDAFLANGGFDVAPDDHLAHHGGGAPVVGNDLLPHGGFAELDGNVQPPAPDLFGSGSFDFSFLHAPGGMGSDVASGSNASALLPHPPPPLDGPAPEKKRKRSSSPDRVTKGSRLLGSNDGISSLHANNANTVILTPEQLFAIFHGVPMVNTYADYDGQRYTYLGMTVAGYQARVEPAPSTSASDDFDFGLDGFDGFGGGGNGFGGNGFGGNGFGGNDDYDGFGGGGLLGGFDGFGTVF